MSQDLLLFRVQLQNRFLDFSKLGHGSRALPRMPGGQLKNPLW
jgi:hypothetical protein